MYIVYSRITEPKLRRSDRFAARIASVVSHKRLELLLGGKPDKFEIVGTKSLEKYLQPIERHYTSSLSDLGTVFLN